jgi:hypothetical protein
MRLFIATAAVSIEGEIKWEKTERAENGVWRIEQLF